MRNLFNKNNYLKAGFKEDRARLFSIVLSDKARGGGCKMNHQETLLLLSTGTSLPEQLCSLPVIFKRCLAMVLGNML